MFLSEIINHSFCPPQRWAFFMQSLKITQTIEIIQNNRNLSLIRLLQTTIVNLFWLYFI